MDLSLSARNVILRGGSKGIGREICRAFLGEGASVAFCARNAEQVEATVKELSPLGTIHGTSLDGADGAALASWVAETAGRNGGIDCVVSNVSAMSVGSGDENWRKGLEIDILGTQHLMTAAIPHVTKAAPGTPSSRGCPRSSFTTGTNLVIDGALTQRVDD